MSGSALREQQGNGRRADRQILYTRVWMHCGAGRFHRGPAGMKGTVRSCREMGCRARSKARLTPWSREIRAAARNERFRASLMRSQNQLPFGQTTHNPTPTAARGRRSRHAGPERARDDCGCHAEPAYGAGGQPAPKTQEQAAEQYRHQPGAVHQSPADPGTEGGRRPAGRHGRAELRFFLQRGASEDGPGARPGALEWALAEPCGIHRLHRLWSQRTLHRA